MNFREKMRAECPEIAANRIRKNLKVDSIDVDVGRRDDFPVTYIEVEPSQIKNNVNYFLNNLIEETFEELLKVEFDTSKKQKNALLTITKDDTNFNFEAFCDQLGYEFQLNIFQKSDDRYGVTLTSKSFLEEQKK